MAQQLIELVEQFCIYQRKQRGRTEGGVKTYRWNLEQLLVFVRAREGRFARITDLTTPTIQAWLDEMAAGDLAVNTLRCRLSTLSSFCGWLVKRGHLAANPTVPIDRPPREAATPAVAGSAIMDALIDAAKQRGRPRDLAIFLLLRFTGMRRGSVANLRVRHLDEGWGLRGVRVKGGKTQDIPLPSAVMAVLKLYVECVLTPECEKVTPDTAAVLVDVGPAARGPDPAAHGREEHLAALQDVRPADRLPGAPAACAPARRGGEVLEQRHDLEEVRALLGHARIDTTQIYTHIRPPQLKRAVAFYEAQAQRMLTR